MNMGFNQAQDRDRADGGVIRPDVDPVGMGDMPGSSVDGRDGISDENRKFSLASGLGGGPEGLPEADDFAFIDGQKSQGRLLNQTTLLVVLLALVAGASLFAMRLTKGQTDMAVDPEVELKIEEALARFSLLGAGNPNGDETITEMQRLFQNTDKILSVFSVSTSEVQIPSEYLAKNPFRFDRVERVVVEDKAVVVSESGQQGRLRELQSEFDQLTLQTVMHGRVPVAIIKGKLLQIGHHIGSFKVTEITGMSVTLVAERQLFRLSMDQGTTMNAPKRGGYH